MGGFVLLLEVALGEALDCAGNWLGGVFEGLFAGELPCGLLGVLFIGGKLAALGRGISFCLALDSMTEGLGGLAGKPDLEPNRFFVTLAGEAVELWVLARACREGFLLVSDDSTLREESCLPCVPFFCVGTGPEAELGVCPV